MGNKYSGLQIGIHWLVFFFWLLWLTPRWSYAVLRRVVIGPGLI